MQWLPLHTQYFFLTRKLLHTFTGTSLRLRNGMLGQGSQHRVLISDICQQQKIYVRQCPGRDGWCNQCIMHRADDNPLTRGGFYFFPYLAFVANFWTLVNRLQVYTDFSAEVIQLSSDSPCWFWSLNGSRIRTVCSVERKSWQVSVHVTSLNRQKRQWLSRLTSLGT